MYTQEQLAQFEKTINDYESQLEALDEQKDFKRYQFIEQKLCELCNNLAMSQIQKDDHQSAFQLLKRAEFISEKSNFMKCATYNNLACYYRRRRMIKNALVYLHKALQIENNPDTQLNLCAVLSQAGKHEQALESAMSSVILLQNQFINENQQSIIQQKASLLCIAYHNLAVELEHVKRLPESIRYYNKALALAQRFLEKDSNILKSIEQTREQAQKSVFQAMKKEKQQKSRSKMTTAKIYSVSRVSRARSTSPFNQRKQDCDSGAVTKRASSPIRLSFQTVSQSYGIQDLTPKTDRNLRQSDDQFVMSDFDSYQSLGAISKQPQRMPIDTIEQYHNFGDLYSSSSRDISPIRKNPLQRDNDIYLALQSRSSQNSTFNSNKVLKLSRDDSITQEFNIQKQGNLDIVSKTIDINDIHNYENIQDFPSIKQLQFDEDFESSNEEFQLQTSKEKIRPFNPQLEKEKTIQTFNADRSNSYRRPGRQIVLSKDLNSTRSLHNQDSPQILSMLQQETTHQKTLSQNSNIKDAENQNNDFSAYSESNALQVVSQPVLLYLETSIEDIPRVTEDSYDSVMEMIKNSA